MHRFLGKPNPSTPLKKLEEINGEFKRKDFTKVKRQELLLYVTRCSGLFDFTDAKDSKEAIRISIDLAINAHIARIDRLLSKRKLTQEQRNAQFTYLQFLSLQLTRMIDPGDELNHHLLNNRYKQANDSKDTLEETFPSANYSALNNFIQKFDRRLFPVEIFQYLKREPV